MKKQLLTMMMLLVAIAMRVSAQSPVSEFAFTGTNTWMTFYDSNYSYNVPAGVKAYVVTNVNTTDMSVSVEEVAAIYKDVPMLLERTDFTKQTFTATSTSASNADIAAAQEKCDIHYQPSRTGVGDYNSRQYANRNTYDYVLYNDEFIRADGIGSIEYIPQYRCVISLFDMVAINVGGKSRMIINAPSSRTAENVVQIGSLEDLLVFVLRVNNGETTLNAQLTADIDAKQREIFIQLYEGMFDGGGHTISNLYNSSYNQGNYGFIGTLFQGGVVSNLHLKNATIEGEYAIGGIVGSMEYVGTEVSNCSVSGRVWATNNCCGGIVGRIDYMRNNVEGTPAVISGCKFYGEVIGSKEYYGGIVGSAVDDDDKTKVHATLSSNTSYGTVVSYNYNEASKYVGALFGYINEHTTLINNAYNIPTAKVSIWDSVNDDSELSPEGTHRAVGMTTSGLVADIPGQFEGKNLAHSISTSSNTEAKVLYVDKTASIPGELVTLKFELPENPNFYFEIMPGYPSYSATVATNVAQSRSAGPSISGSTPLTPAGENTWTFTMPDYNVVVDVCCSAQLKIDITNHWATTSNLENVGGHRYYAVPAGVKAYTVTAVDAEAGTVSITEQTVIDGNVPMLLERTDETKTMFLLEPVELATAPQMARCTEFKSYNESYAAATGQRYILSGDAFVRFSGNSMKPYHCFLEISNNNARELLTIVNATATETVSISNVDELIAFATRVNAGENELNAVLTQDIDLGWNTQVEIGNLSASYSARRRAGGVEPPGYKGTFDGQGHAIYNFSRQAALFNKIDAEGVLKNLTVRGETQQNGGGIVGVNHGKVSNCVSDIKYNNYSDNNSHSKCSYIGGVCYLNDGTIENCSFIGTIRLSISFSNNVPIQTIGGVVSRNSGIIKNSTCYGSIIINRSSNAYLMKTIGLIVGESSGILLDNYYNSATARITDGQNDYYTHAIGTVPSYGNYSYATDKISEGEPKFLGYEVVIDNVPNFGTVVADKRFAVKGETVTLTTTTTSGWEMHLTLERIALGSEAESRSNAPEIGSTVELTPQGEGVYTFTMPQGHVHITATFTEKTGHIISVDPNIPHGAVTPDKLEADEGDIVTITCQPQTGYALFDLTINMGNTQVEFTKVGDAQPWEITTYQFTMPAGDVMLKGEYKLKEDVTAISTSTATVTTDGAWYTVDGRRLEGRPTRRGIYIYNGQKVAR